MNLKKCPFCGGEAKVIKKLFKGQWVYYVECWFGCFAHLDTNFNKSELAIQAWNRRVK